VLSPLSLVRRCLILHRDCFSFCTISPACRVRSVSVLERKGFDKVGWLGRSAADVSGIRRSEDLTSACAQANAETLTLNLDFRIWVNIGSGSHCSLCPLVLIVAVDFVAIFVNKWRISTYNISIEPCVLNLLRTTSVHVPNITV